MDVDTMSSMTDDARPTLDDIETALDVLLWLHENTTDGGDRDEISHVRYMLDSEE